MTLLLRYLLIMVLHHPFYLCVHIINIPFYIHIPKQKVILIHTGGLITSHFWLEIPLKLQHQTIQIKALVCDLECPYDLILGQTAMAQLSTWQDYASHKLYLQQISIPLTVRNNIRILPRKDRSSFIDFTTQQDIIHSQTYYHR